MSKEEIKKMLQGMTKKELIEAILETESKPQKKGKRRGRGKRKRGATTNASARENKFDDLIKNTKLTSDEEQELEIASKADQDASPNPLRGRRNSAKKIKVRCSVCAKDFNMFPSLVNSPDRWSCNNCLVGRRG
jgi:hypothetical protein